MSDTQLVALGVDDAPAVDDAHRVLFTFPDDHDINGMKVEIIGVTAEQCAVAIMYLARMADRLLDHRELQAMQDAGQLAAVRDMLAKGH